MCVHMHAATQIIYSYYPDLPTTRPQQSPHNMNLLIERRRQQKTKDFTMYLLAIG